MLGAAKPESQRHMSVNPSNMESPQPAMRSVGGIEVSPLPRSDWTREDIHALFDLPFNDLLFAAQWVHRQIFDPNAVQVSTLLSIRSIRLSAMQRRI